MKSSFGKLGRRLSMQRSDVKEIHHHQHQPSVYIDQLNQASKDMQDMRNCYDGLLSAAAATANSIYEFSESLNEMGSCLLEKTVADADAESGKVLSTLGNMQLELQKIADAYRSYVIVTITNPSESLLSELRKVEEMKLQCDEKREVYEYMMTQHREKGKLRNGKVESSIAQKLLEAQDEYDEVTRLCVFRVKSLKEGQCRSLLTQAARHHAAQLNFFRKGLETLEAVEPFIRNVAEKHRIDYQLIGLPNRESAEGEPMSGYESTDDGELSFDYKQKKHGLDDDGTSPNQMELDQVDLPYLQPSKLEDSEISLNKHRGEQPFGRQTRVSSYSAPLFPDKIDASERPKETQPPRKFYSHVLPPPVVDTRNPILRPSPSVSQSIPSQNDHQKHLRRISADNTSTSAALAPKVQSTIKDGNSINSSTQLPTPSAGRFSFSQWDNFGGTDSKAAKRQSYSGPLPPSKQFSFKMTSNNSGPIASTGLPQPPSRAPFSQPNLSSNVSRSVSPPPISSPKISELHELPRPPSAFSKPVVISGGLVGHSAPLFVKNQEISPPNKKAMLTSTCASPLPLPPPVPKSLSMPSSKNET
ncbi:putative arfaptin homology domain/BAR domain protein [Tanacetum coccineum]